MPSVYLVLGALFSKASGGGRGYYPALVNLQVHCLFTTDGFIVLSSSWSNPKYTVCIRNVCTLVEAVRSCSSNSKRIPGTRSLISKVGRVVRGYYPAMVSFEVAYLVHEDLSAVLRVYCPVIV